MYLEGDPMTLRESRKSGLNNWLHNPKAYPRLDFFHQKEITIDRSFYTQAQSMEIQESWRETK